MNFWVNFKICAGCISLARRRCFFTVTPLIGFRRGTDSTIYLTTLPLSQNPLLFSKAHYAVLIEVISAIRESQY